MKRSVTLAAVAALALVLASCSSATPEASPTTSPPSSTAAQIDFLAAHDLGDMDGQQIIDHLDQMSVADRPTDLMASVRADELVLADGEQEVTVPLEEEGGFYLSVAPYVDQTHECYYHSLTTCRGELANEDVSVRIVDETGDALVDEQVTTFDNGFVGFWLPHDVEGTIEVTFDGRTGQSAFSTGEEGATCLTTLQLAEA
ncbi:MAG TPA: CueP family metal-binding protein [Beutenbergiaceae bacterium]|nr:CueP family metal-binding protein [Beutenbergiaceae bacterium]